MKRAALFVAARQPVLDCSLFKSRILGSPSLEMGKFGRSACRALSPIADWQESTPNSKWGRVSMSDPISAIKALLAVSRKQPPLLPMVGGGVQSHLDDTSIYR